MSTAPSPSRQTEKLLALALALATLTAYWQVRHAQFVTFDDQVYVSRNSHVQAGVTWQTLLWSFTSTEASNWHPLTWLSLALDAQVYHADARGYHITNLLLHTANVLLLFHVLRRMTQACWPSAFAAGLFALHPLHVESVAWVSERKDVLSTAFWILTMLAYTRYVERPGGFRYLLVLVALAAGLLAKPMLVTLPFVLFLFDYWPLCRLHAGKQMTADGAGTTWGFLLVEKIPLFLLAAGSCVMTLYAQTAGGAVRSLAEVPLASRLANAAVAYNAYLGKTVWPHRLAVLYPRLPLSWSDWRVLGASALLVGITVVALQSRKRRPYLTVGWLWYVGTLVPVIGLVPVGDQAFADRYTYVPLIGLFLIAAWGGAELITRRRGLTGPVGLLAVAILVACGVRTWLQVGSWHDSIALWQQAIAAGEPNAPAHYSLAFAYSDQGCFDQALAELRTASRQDPNDQRAHVQLAFILSRQGELNEAVSHYNEALRLDPGNAAAHLNLTIDLIKLGNRDEAKHHLDEAGRLSPELKSTPQYQDALAKLSAAP